MIMSKCFTVDFVNFVTKEVIRVGNGETLLSELKNLKWHGVYII